MTRIAVQKKKRRRAKLLRRRRITCLVVTVFIISVVTISCLNKKPCEIADYATYTVCAGDTLWDIARTHKKSNIDTRKVIWQIEELNNLTDAMIYAGDILTIPVYKD